MLQRTVFPGRYIQGDGALRELGTEVARLGDRALLVCSPHALRHLVPRVSDELDGTVGWTAEGFAGECSDAEIERLGERARALDATVVVGVGGGKTLDAAKVVAHHLRVPVAMVPTIASTDAPCSAVAIVYSPDGVFERVVSLPRNPELVLADTSVIARAPVRFLVAGMGDALATWFEAESCRLSRASNVAGGLGSMTAHALSRLCYDTLLADGIAARDACSRGVVAPALERVVEANTLLSGLGFESCGLATAHSIHNGLTALPGARSSYHGEKVAFGTLVSLFLTGTPRATIDEVSGFCRNVGLPTRLADLGLGDVSDDDLRRVAEKTCAPGESVHHEPRPVTPDDVAAAIREADRHGREAAASPAPTSTS